MSEILLLKKVIDLILEYQKAKEIPESESQNATTNSVKSSEETFLQQWNGAATSATDFYNAYREFCVAQELPYAQNVKSLGIRLKPFIRDGKLKKVRREAGFVYTAADFRGGKIEGEKKGKEVYE
jgi:hypothetical protein